VWGSSDQFRFVYQQISGDVDIVARIDDLQSTKSYAKAGLMIRSSLSASSRHVFAHVTKGAGVRLIRRLSDGGTSTVTAGPSVTAPVWLRVVRTGSTVKTYSSTTGTSWTALTTETLALGTSAYVGLAVNGVSATTRSTAVFSSVSLAGAAQSGLPAGQRNMDVGGPAIAGSTTYTAGTYTIKAAGADIWDVADQFHFVYQPVTGDVEVVARVASITRQHDWSKAGVMVRESLTAASRHATTLVSSKKGYAFQRRQETGEYSVHTSGGSGTPPGWVKLVRTGDLFESFRSADGVAWKKIGSDTIPMGDTVYVGLAVTSHNTAAATTAVVGSFKISSSATGNQPPAVSITAPANGTQVASPTTVTVTATATDPENRLASVDFYAGSTLLVRDATAPYSASWSANTGGTYPLTAVAHDQDGGSTISGAVSVTVTSANVAPTVSLTTNGTSFTAPATVALTANAADPEGQLTRVEFFRGTTMVGSDTSGSPYTYSWTNVAAGTYTLTAVAIDAAGNRTTSSAVNVTVSNPVSTPPRLVVFTASSDHATNVTSYRFDVFTSGANPATATPVATANLGKPTPASNGDITSDQSTLFSNLAPGNYIATVTAIGPGGSTRSATVSFTR
jgi:regulation of enolase protein 1 (concanavalin A-like superfamily)